MKILITGGTGFIGSHLTNDLVKLGHELVLLTRNNTKVKNIQKIDSVIVDYVDVTNFSALQKSILSHNPTSFVGSSSLSSTSFHSGPSLCDSLISFSCICTHCYIILQ